MGPPPMFMEDLRLLRLALTARENWLLPEEVRELHDLRRKVEIGWPMSTGQREMVQSMVRRSRERHPLHSGREG
jgi:hypothetical protein